MTAARVAGSGQDRVQAKNDVWVGRSENGSFVEIRKHPMGPVPKWGLYFYWGRGITRVVFNRPLYPAHVDASDSSTFRVVFPESWRAFF